jgi:hypothetical protein
VECFQVLKLLSEYADGLLDPASRARVEEHLSACESCSAEWKALVEVIDGIGKMERVKAPVKFLEGIHARIEKRSLARRIAGIFQLPRYMKVPMEVAGVIAAVLLVVLIQEKMMPAGRNAYSPQVSKTTPPTMRELPQAGEKSLRIRPVPRPSAQAPVQVVPERAPAPHVGAPAVPAPPPVVRQVAPEGGRAPESAGSAAKDGTNRFAPSRSKKLADEVSNEAKPIVIVLQLKTYPQAGDKTGEEAEVGSSTVDSAAPRQEAEAKGELRTAEPSKSRAAVNRPKAAPVPAPSEQAALSRVRVCVLRAGGTVVSVDSKEQPISVTATIPRERVAELLENLGQIGGLQVPSRLFAGRGPELMSIKIELRPSR